MNCDFLKICVNIPPEFSDRVMDEINNVMTAMYPGYDRTFTSYPVTGTWRPLNGSRPYKGEAGRIETADEIRIEFAIHPQDLEGVISTIRRIHPYEEPAIDILPMIGWKNITP